MEGNMPRNYQVKKNNPYWMPHNLHMQMVYLIDGYEELLEQKKEVLYGSNPPPDGQPKGNSVGNPTEKKGLVLAEINSKIDAIEQVMFDLRAKYANTCTGEPFKPLESFRNYGVFCYFQSKKGKDKAPSPKTWRRYRSEFACKVAKKINFF